MSYSSDITVMCHWASDCHQEHSFFFYCYYLRKDSFRFKFCFSEDHEIFSTTEQKREKSCIRGRTTMMATKYLKGIGFFVSPHKGRLAPHNLCYFSVKSAFMTTHLWLKSLSLSGFTIITGFTQNTGELVNFEIQMCVTDSIWFLFRSVKVNMTAFWTVSQTKQPI